MNKLMSLDEAYAQFINLIEEGDYPGILDDEIAMREAWNDYTDSLCKDGYLSGLQYHYAPSYGEDMPGDLIDDFNYVMDEMGFCFGFEPVQDEKGKYYYSIRRGDSEYKLLALCYHVSYSDMMHAVLEDEKALVKLKITASEAEEISELLEAIL